MNGQLVVVGVQHRNAHPIVAAKQAEVGVARRDFSVTPETSPHSMPWRSVFMPWQNKCVAGKNLDSNYQVKDRPMGFEPDHHPHSRRD